MNKFQLALLALVVVLAASSAQALINPNFTPLQLVEQADLIYKVTLKAGDKPLTLKAQVVGALKPKGAAPKGEITIDLTTCPHEDQAKKIAELAKGFGKEPALLFAGAFKEEGEAGGQELNEAYLHFGQFNWVGLYKAKDGGYEMDKLNSHMEGTFAGSVDMFIKMIEYILSDPEPTVPCTTEASWDAFKKIGKIDGKARAAMAVDLGGGLAQTLFVAADSGDKLFAWDDKEKTLLDVTATHKLASKSQLAAWGDFDHDGKVDLASFDGKAISLQLQQADGAFAAKPLEAGDALKKALTDGCVGLAVVDSGKEGRAGLLVSTLSWPILLAPGADGAWTATPLGTGDLPAGKEFGKALPCLVGDIDGDAIADVVQMFPRGGLVYKGKAPGQFDKPAVCQIEQGDGPSKAFFGDYDADGLLDIFTVADDRPRLWHNLGQGKFAETLQASGEIAYISKPGGIDGMSGDVNNDGRQDILIIYAKELSPHLFFNRGFRSTGHAHDLDLDERGLSLRDDDPSAKGSLPDAHKGQQAGCLGDFNGDGAQDMAVVIHDGELWVFFRKVFEDEAALSVRVSLPTNGPVTGPITVTGFRDKRPLGAWNVVAGSQPAFFAQRGPGKCLIKWQLPGGKGGQKEVMLDTKPLQLQIDAGK